MRKPVLILFVILTGSCIVPHFSDNFGKIEGAAEIALELNSHTADTALQKQVVPVADPLLVERFVAELNNAPEAGPMKGAGWHRIRVWKGDTTWDFCTDGKVFGKNASGMFYKFKSDNILKEYFHIDTDRRE
jgi:hypothetical protein